MFSLEQIDRLRETGHSAGGPAADVLALGCAPPPEHDPRPVHELAAEFARRTPDAVAVRSGSESVSYAELDAWAGRVAARVVAAGAEPGSRVAVLVEPSVAMIAAVLGVLRAGAAYVPVDLAQPGRRVAAVLEDANAEIAVVSAGTAYRLAELDVLRVRAEYDEPVPDVTLPVAGIGDPAYVIYTSGSTGEPKGVLVDHGALAASTAARRHVYPGEPVFLLVSPLAFDSSVAGLWGTLTAGGTLVVAGPDEVSDPARLVELVHTHRVTRLLCVPSLYGVLLDAAERAGTERLSSLDTVIVAGEALPEALVQRHFAVHDHSVALVNEYGPTEATVWASYRRFDRPGPVSIGGPVPGARLYVLDEDGRPQPRGVAGELYIGGVGVALGYLGRPEATARAFTRDPFAGVEGARMYRTGDRVRWTDEGTLEFLGRSDHQVKIRGHRVELGAVEAALLGAPGVQAGAVSPDSGVTRLVAFAVVSPGVTAESIRAHLADRLGPAALPGRIELLDALPVTFSGKLDRVKLRAAADEVLRRTGPAGNGHAAPGGMPARVAAAWAEVLQLSDVPVDVNFFDLGGHSLTLFQLQNALEQHTGTRPSVVTLFRHTTVAAQAELISGGGKGAEGASAEQRQAAARRARMLRARRQRAAEGPAR
ncbi:non-ribosomal peptide synthetase [Amycolatopsis sp. NPDC059021]|uniref:non-ribosomal peptide synthetase n=1 Tax=Amycolatopsis sp. NPDC059021 TaxID=3346704 RepID=UPI00366C4B74